MVFRLCGNLKWLRISSRIEALSNLLFVDDILLLGEPTVEEATKYKSIMEGYEVSSGQKAIPTYFMSLFEIPASTTKDITYIQRAFLWSGKEEKNNFFLVAWDK
ncbi:hypothetical protein KI387_037562, partial [Taxus chinensis]